MNLTGTYPTIRIPWKNSIGQMSSIMTGPEEETHKLAIPVADLMADGSIVGCWGVHTISGRSSRGC